MPGDENPVEYHVPDGDPEAVVDETDPDVEAVVDEAHDDGEPVEDDDAYPRAQEVEEDRA